VNVLPFETRVRIVGALVEGNSIRSTERMLGIHRDTIMRFGVLAGSACERFHNKTLRAKEIMPGFKVPARVN